MTQPRKDPLTPDPRHAGAGRYMGVGLQFAASIALFLFGGMWVDGRWGTEPWGMVAGVIVGGGAGFWSMYRQLVVEPREQDRKDRTP